MMATMWCLGISVGAGVGEMLGDTIMAEHMALDIETRDEHT